MKKQICLKLAVLLVASIFLFSLVNAEVGVGISPSKIKEQVVGGEKYFYEFLVFNTGTDPMEVFLTVSGDLAEFTIIEPESVLIEPEPEPHELPIKNGESFTVTFDVPSSYKGKTVTGTIAAVGSGNSQSNFGGSVGVSSQVELDVLKPTSFFAKIPTTVYIILAVILGLLLIIFIAKKLGLKIEFKKK